VLDYLERAQEAMADLSSWFAEGKLRYRIDVVDGLENAVRAVNKLFDGSHKEKLIVKVSDV
jgi:NADPH-dependent curcumin reductase CurA